MDNLREHIHFIGIGGTGLSAIARVLLERGYQVSGSDRQISPLAENLRDLGAVVFTGHAPENISGANLVVRSSAIPDTNVEVRTAAAQGIPVLKRSEFLGQLIADQIGIAVAGTHGKTTTTGMIAWMLTALRRDPSFILGGIVENLGVNARSGKGPHFVIEADEYDRMFLGLSPYFAIITNVEHDHPDCYPTSEDFSLAFQQFVGRVKSPGKVIICGDDLGAAALIPLAKEKNNTVFSYGIDSGNDYYASKMISKAGTGFSFDVEFQGKTLTHIQLQVPGRHNVQNALAAFAVGHIIGLNPSEISWVLETFKGTGRRFEIQGEVSGVLVIDDYAHHPTEIIATLSAARARYPQKELWVVWQPHTYSRTLTLWDSFARAFLDANHVIITDVYAARENLPPGFSIDNLVAVIEHPDVQHLSGMQVISDYLLQNMKRESVLLTLSAGDANQVGRLVLAGLSKQASEMSEFVHSKQD